MKAVQLVCCIYNAQSPEGTALTVGPKDTEELHVVRAHRWCSCMLVPQHATPLRVQYAFNHFTYCDC